MENYGETLLRCLWVAIFVERTVATVYRDFYETRIKYCILISISLAFECHIISGILQYSEWFIGIDLNYTQSFAFILDIVAISV